jgi:hypothetical protein
LPQLRNIQRLVENAFFHGAIAEKDHRHRACFLHLRGKSRPGGERETAADDGRGVNDFQIRRGDVKRARPSTAVARFPADNLGQHFARISTFGDDVAVIAMGAEDEIILLQSFAHRDPGRFLADINMKVAANQTLIVFIEPNDVLFSPPDHQHPLQDAELLLPGYFR